MNRRRKRKKQRGSSDEGTPPPSPAPVQNPLKDTSPLPSAPSSEDETNLASTPPIPAPPASPPPDTREELEADLGDDFDEEMPSPTTSKVSLPSGEGQSEMRRCRRVTEALPAPVEKEDSVRPTKMHKSASSRRTQNDEPGDLEDEPDQPLPPAPLTEKEAPKVDSAPATAADQNKDEQPPTVEETPDTTPIATPIEKAAEQESTKPAETSHWKANFKEKLTGLSLIEQASLGVIVLLLAALTIWFSAVISENIPNTVIASKLKYPLEGKTAAIASFESYWRSPIREGEQIDEGVSETIAVIPEIKITLGSDSKAKALRLLFRDEEGRFVGDATTLEASGGQFLPSRSVTAETKGKTATVNATTGFRFADELISYLADDDFQWEVVILESKDGKTFQDFIAIPLSPNRKDSL